MDILILGNSHAYSTYSPNIIDAICGTNSFVLASNSQKLEQTYYNLKEALKYHHPKIIVIQLSVLSGDSWKKEVGDYRVYSNLDGMKYSLNKLKAVFTQRPKADYINSMFPFFRNHNNWKDSKLLASNLERLENVKNEDYRGFSPRESEMGNKVTEQYKLSKKQDLSNYKISKSDESYLDKIKTLSKENKFKVVYVMSPKYSDLLNSTYTKKYNILKKVVSKYGDGYFDFNMLSREIGLKERSFENGYIGYQHTSYFGAVQVSTYLANHFKNEYFGAEQLKTPDKYWYNRMSNKKESYLYGSFLDMKSKTILELGNRLKLFDDIFIDKVFVLKKRRDVYELIIEFDDKTNIDKLSMYKFYVHLYPKASDTNLKPESKDFGFENFDFQPYTLPLRNGKIYVNKEINTKIKEVEKLNLGLFKSGLDRSEQITLINFNL
ncbi:MAG: hypothetical protein R2814_01605 [Flavobacteriaceae bacterium]